VKARLKESGRRVKRDRKERERGVKEERKERGRRVKREGREGESKARTERKKSEKRVKREREGRVKEERKETGSLTGTPTRGHVLAHTGPRPRAHEAAQRSKAVDGSGAGGGERGAYKASPLLVLGPERNLRNLRNLIIMLA
jgi:hypothetical protein